MTVTELIRILEKMPKNAIVVMATDSEGNGFSPLASADPYRYAAECPWFGALTNDTVNGVPCVSLWPTK